MDSKESPNTATAIVVANNDETVLRAVSSTLQKAGFAVTGAANAAAALARVSESESAPTLAVIDTTVPGMDWQDLAKKLYEKSPGIRLLFLSAEPSSETLRTPVLRGHHTRLLGKPFRRSQLLGQVLEMMDEPLVMIA